MKYWLSTFSEGTWGDFVAAGSEVARFAEKRWSTVERIQVGDVFICYILGKKVFVASLTAIGPATKDTKGKWNSKRYPIQVPVQARRSLRLTQGVPIGTLKEELSWFRELKTPSSWTYRLRNDPYEVRADDAKKILVAIEEAHGSLESVTTSLALKPPQAKPTHDEIQWLLLSLGNEMGFDLWVASNDRNKSFEGHQFSKLSRLRNHLPIQFDAKTQKIIEFIDVLWLRGNTIVAAFEIEHTTAIYSGLLRMSDLMTLQPNINIDLFIVAPDDRSERVKSEIKRPTFAKARLPRVCRYIAYSRLTKRIKQAKAGGFLRHLSPSFLDEIAEDIFE